MMKNTTSIVMGILLAGTTFSQAFGFETRWPEGSLHGFPTMLDQKGTPIADGDGTQYLDGNVLVVKSTFVFSDGRTTAEESRFLQSPTLRQLSWKWKETKGKTTLRDYSVDFEKKTAHAMKLDDGKEKVWDETFKDLNPDITFAGGGVNQVIKNVYDRLQKGEHIKVKVIGMTPKPRMSEIEIYVKGKEAIILGGRTFDADHVIIHPTVFPLIKVVMGIPDNHLWLHQAMPPAFLRFEGPQMEFKDPIGRIDVYAPKPAITGKDVML